MSAELAGRNFRVTDSSGEKRPLTSLRGLAALWVFVTHVAVSFYIVLPPRLASSLTCGWLGVDVFFVLSGFILAKIYSGLELQGWGRFWARRVFRVFPLNLVIVGGLALGVAARMNTGAVVDWDHLPWHLLMLQSFVPGHKAGWIFVNWSVGIELICYIAFPVIAIMFRQLNTRALGFIAVLLGLMTWWAQTLALNQFFGPLAVLRGGSDFLLGAACGVLSLRMRRLPVISAAGIEILGLAVIVFGTTGGIGSAYCTAQGSWRMALVPLGAAGLIYALASDAGPVARVLRLGPLLWLGRISFSLYLLQQPLLNRAKEFLVLARGWPPSVADILVWGLCVLAVTICLAFATYFLVEQPGRRFGEAIWKWAAGRGRGTPTRARAPVPEPVAEAVEPVFAPPALPR